MTEQRISGKEKEGLRRLGRHEAGRLKPSEVAWCVRWLDETEGLPMRVRGRLLRVLGLAYVAAEAGLADQGGRVEELARRLCNSRNETEQNAYRAQLGHLLCGWPDPTTSPLWPAYKAYLERA